MAERIRVDDVTEGNRAGDVTDGMRVGGSSSDREQVGFDGGDTGGRDAIRESARTQRPARPKGATGRPPGLARQEIATRRSTASAATVAHEDRPTECSRIMRAASRRPISAVTEAGDRYESRRTSGSGIARAVTSMMTSAK
ncbi:hypothetical protein GCM10027280_20640 [Micromonospora polyrhachis]